MAIAALLVPGRGLSLLLLLGYGVQGYRVARYRVRQDDDTADARLWAGFNLIGKLAEGLGLLKFYLNGRLQHHRIQVMFPAQAIHNTRVHE